jgi:hypothetical protein
MNKSTNNLAIGVFIKTELVTLSCRAIAVVFGRSDFLWAFKGFMLRMYFVFSAQSNEQSNQPKNQLLIVQKANLLKASSCDDFIWPA